MSEAILSLRSNVWATAGRVPETAQLRRGNSRTACPPEQGSNSSGCVHLRPFAPFGGMESSGHQNSIRRQGIRKRLFSNAFTCGITENAGNLLLNRPVPLAGDMPSLFDTLHRIAIRILLIRSPVMLALLFRLGLFLSHRTTLAFLCH